MLRTLMFQLTCVLLLPTVASAGWFGHKSKEAEEIQKNLTFEDLNLILVKIKDSESEFLIQKKQMETKFKDEGEPFPLIVTSHFDAIKKNVEELKRVLKKALDLRSLGDVRAAQGPTDDAIRQALQQEADKLTQNVAAQRNVEALFDNERVELRNAFSHLYDSIALFYTINKEIKTKLRCDKIRLKKIRKEFKETAKIAHIVLDPKF